MVEETERMDLWVVSGGEVQSPKVFAISKKEPHVKAAQEVLCQWAGGVVGEISSMEDSEPKFALGLQSSSVVLFEDKVSSMEAAWKQALATTQGVNMWGFYKASGAVDKDTAGAKLILSTMSPCAVKPADKHPGLAMILDVVSRGATLKTKAKLISMWRVRPHDGQEVFAPFGVALIAARKITLSSERPTEITNN